MKKKIYNKTVIKAKIYCHDVKLLIPTFSKEIVFDIAMTDIKIDIDNI
ncbi:MAG: hypothetical protein ACRCZK_05740 [Oscillospiraceae bacterium]